MLSEIWELLFTFSKFNSNEKFINLLNRLKCEIEKLKKKTQQKQQHSEKKSEKLRFSLWHQSSNVVTRSCLLMLQIWSHLQSEHISDISKQCLISDLTFSIDCSSSVSESAFQATDISLLNDDDSAAAKIDTITDLKLKQKIQECQNSFCEQSFIIICDEHSETVHLTEIDDFFLQFQKRVWLSIFNLMLLIFSFHWSSMILLLHSSFMLFTEIENDNSKCIQKQWWLLNNTHNQMILLCCFWNHWILFDVNIKCSVIQQYNSLAENISESAEITSMIKEQLAQVIKEQKNTSFIMKVEVCSFCLVSRFFSDCWYTQISQQQINSADCEIFITYNTDCLKLGQDMLEKQIDSIQLWYHYLECLLKLELQKRSEQQIMNMILFSEKKLRVKWHCISEDILADELS